MKKPIERALSCKISDDILVELNCAINDKNDQKSKGVSKWQKNVYMSWLKKKA